MTDGTHIRAMTETVEEIKRLAGELYESSEDFPAVNRNAKRILASIEMLRINLEGTED